MNTIASELDSLIDHFFDQLKKIPEDKFSNKPLPNKWSKKEITGHLIDSAENNIRRFIKARYEDNPSIKYDQDMWVRINNYQHQPSENVIQLWYLLNKQIVTILNNTPGEHSQRKSTEQTIEWLAKDYIVHMKHHMHVVLDLEAVAYP